MATKAGMLLPVVCILALLPVGGIAYFRRGLNEAILLENGRLGIFRALNSASIRHADRGIRPEVTSRKLTPAGVAELTYTVHVAREWADSPYPTAPIAGYTGEMILQIKVLVHQTTTPDDLGFDRPTWAHREAAIIVDRPMGMSEMLWTRLDAEPANVGLDNTVFKAADSDTSAKVIQIASFIRQKRYEMAAGTLVSAMGQPAKWSPIWARRLDAEVKRLQSALEGGDVKPEEEKSVRKALDDFARSPKLAASRRALLAAMARA